jgi:sugar lactone lactonase YvrE
LFTVDDFVSGHLPKWNSTGVTLASGGSNLNQIQHIYGLFIVADTDILYIADSDNNRILKWLPGATSGTLVAGGQGSGYNATQLNSPKEVCVDLNGNVYVADSINYRIQYFSNGSSIGHTIAGNGTNRTMSGYMFGLGIDLNNNVYSSEYNLARVIKWSPNSTNGTQVAGTGVQGTDPDQLSTPTAFYIDPKTATLYIPNQTSHCVTKWLAGSSSGTAVAGICGIQGSNETLLDAPTCVTFDKYGNMYVIDGSNGGRVIVFCPDSLVGNVIVDSGLNNPISIAVDTHLNIYVSDWNNVRLVNYTLL